MAPPHKKTKRTWMSAKAAALKVVRRLQEQGHEAVLAGGCVRDMLMGHVPHDYDLATSATPDVVMQLFDRTWEVGAKFGVVVVRLGGRQMEVATFRSDLAYVDGRRPVGVVFTSAQEDAQRRDFTVNGMFYDPITNQVVDHVGGQADLQRRVLRAIGDAEARFAEDHLRMLRAVRFACRLEFKIAPATWQAVKTHSHHLCKMSPERIRGELERILVDPQRVRGITLLRESGLIDSVLPHQTPAQLDYGTKVLASLPKQCSFALALAALVADCPVAGVTKLATDLRASNKLRQQVEWLVGGWREFLAGQPMTRGQLKRWAGRSLFEALLILCRCCLKAQNQSDAVLRAVRRQLRALGDEPLHPRRLLDGHQLIKLGAIAGPMVGQLGEELYLAQLEDEVKTKPQARQWVAQWLATHADPDGRINGS